METNFFGLIRVTRAALPHLRESKGMLVNFSSVAGLIGHAGTGVYNASKFAVEGLSESLAQELEAFGVKVMLVNPDALKSEFFAERAGNLRLDAARRSEERRVGRECVSTCSTRWSRYH